MCARSDASAATLAPHCPKPGTRRAGASPWRCQRSCPGQSKMSHWGVLGAGASRHNGLVGGSSPARPTTQSDANRCFPVSDE